MIVAAPVLRYLLEHRGFNELAMYTLLPCRADALGFGLLLAIVCRHQTSWTWIVSHRRYVYAVFAVLGFGILTWILLDVTLGYTWMAAFYASLLLLVVANPGRVERRIFRSFALTRLGTVAYALYLFHTGILRLCHYMFFRAVPSIQNLSTLCVTLLALGVVMLCAELSWLVLEKPLIKHARSRFQYAMGRQEANLAAQHPIQ
jgi:peptidoglycan/LPS O-acetylase OafA/YrhL